MSTVGWIAVASASFVGGIVATIAAEAIFIGWPHADELKNRKRRK